MIVIVISADSEQSKWEREWMEFWWICQFSMEDNFGYQIQFNRFVDDAPLLKHLMGLRISLSQDFMKKNTGNAKVFISLQ